VPRMRDAAPRRCESATFSSQSDTLCYMWEPMGTLPASVYWRRRWLAVASTTAAVLLVIWLFMAAKFNHP